MDDLELILELLGCFVLLLVTSFFSMASVAYATLSKTAVQKLKEDGYGQADRILALISEPERLYATMLIAKWLAVTGVVVLATMAVLQQHSGLPLPLGTAIALEILILLVLLLAVELVPKVYGLRNPAQKAGRLVGLLTLLCWVFYPLAKPLVRLAGSHGYIFNGKRLSMTPEEELRVVLDLQEEEGEIEHNDKEMIASIIEWGETSVREIMTPRIDMVCALDNMSVAEVLALIKENGHSRVPVYHDNADNILGIIYVKDLLHRLDEIDRQARAVDSDLGLVRNAYFVPETKKIDELLREFQQEKVHLAIVVDEYGGTAGLVTIEDILEEIVGDIQDEYDTEEPWFQVLEDGSWLVNAKLDIEDVNELLQLNLPTDAFDTLGGFVYDMAGRIPEQGEVLTYQNLQLVIRAIDGQRISKINIIKTGQPAASENQSEAIPNPES